MGLFIIIIFVSACVGHNVATEYSDGRNCTSKIPKPYQKCESSLDILIKDLSSQSWQDDRLCLEQILDTINNAKNATLWASYAWDSMQLPVGQLYGSRYHLGNYDQCLRENVGASRPSYSMQYCLADIFLQYSTVNVSPEAIDPFDSADVYIRSKTVLDQRFNEMSWGLCVPRVCQAKSVERFARALLKQSHLGYLQAPVRVTIKCEFPQPRSVNGSTILITFILLTTLTVALCTFYTTKNETKNPSSYADVIIRCFCLKGNYTELMKLPKNDVNVLHGMRFISCGMIVLVHVLFGIYTVTAANGLDFEEQLLSYGQNIFLFITAVDTFFVMSGLLFIRNIKKDSTIKDLIDSIIKRYFRLIWWYITNMMIILFVLPNSGCGPLCSKFVQPEKENCHRTWWTGLLMITNYYDVFSVCALTSWYIFCDFQMSVVASIVFWIHQRHKRVGTCCFVVLTLLSVILPGFTAYFGEEFSTIPLKFDIYKLMRNRDTTTVLMEMYTKTHHRANPYLMGMIMGYVMSNYRAEEIRKFFTKKRVATILLGCILMLIVILIAYVNGSGSLKNAMLLSLHRPIWALLMCALIGVCEYGSFPIVKDVLSWKAFVPLGKLTYGIYMIHFTTIMAILLSTRSTLHFNVGIMIEKYFAHFSLSAIISLFFMLFVESPLNNVVKMILAKRGNSHMKISDTLVKNTGYVVHSQNGGNKFKINDITTDSCQSEHKLKQI